MSLLSLSISESISLYVLVVKPQLSTPGLDVGEAVVGGIVGIDVGGGVIRIPLTNPWVVPSHQT